MTQIIKVCGPREIHKIKKNLRDNYIINVTTSGKPFGWQFSPFHLGPVILKDGGISKNVENAWQFSKVYPQHLEENGTLGRKWVNWAASGYSDTKAYRYPMGKGAKPLYSYYDGMRLDYIEARKSIYIPLYKQGVLNCSEYSRLVQIVKERMNNQQVWFFDYDGYDNVAKNMTFEEVIENPNLTMGHGFVLAMIVEKELKS